VRKHLGDDGFYDTLRVTSRYEAREYYDSLADTVLKFGGEENKVTYSYGGTYNGQTFNNETGYPNFTFDDETDLGELYNCTQKTWYSLTDQTKNPTTVTTFSNAKKVKDVTENIQNEYTYDAVFKDSLSEVKTTVSGNITYVCAEYNDWGGVWRQTKPLTEAIKNNAAQKEKYTTTYQYNAAYKKPETVSYYNDAGGEALTNTTVYDSLGRVVETISENGDKTGYFYENASRPGNLTKTVSYDVTGLQGTSPVNKVNTYTYDAYNAFVASASQNGARTRGYEYEYIWGKLKTETLPNGGYFGYIYDVSGRLTQKISPYYLDNGDYYRVVETYQYVLTELQYTKYYAFQAVVHSSYRQTMGSASALM
jgi:hypothetical protein